MSLGALAGTSWPALILSSFGFGSFAWALRGHFAVSQHLPDGMRVLSAANLIAYANFIACLVLDFDAAPQWRIAGLLAFSASAGLFWWAVSTTPHHRLHLAYSDAAPDIVYSAGPFALVRHPFYTSYIIFWFGTALAAGGWQWLPATLMASWYVQIARQEEARFEASTVSAAYADYRSRTGMMLPRPRSIAMSISNPLLGLNRLLNGKWAEDNAAVASILALPRLFLSYQGTDNEAPVRRDQATILFSLTLLFAFLGVGSATLFTIAFEQHVVFSITATSLVIIALYACLVACGLSWKRHRDDAAFIRRSVIIYVALGLAWGGLVNLFAAVARPDQQGILIGLIMALVSTPMLAVPISASLAFFVPISVLSTAAVLTQPIQNVAIQSYLGFLVFALFGIININKTILERSLGRLSLQKEHETIRIFLHEYEEISSDWLWETNAEGVFRNVGSRMAQALRLDKSRLENISIFALFARRKRQEDDLARIVQFMRERNAFKDATLIVPIGRSVRWLNLTGHPVYDERGLFRGFRGIGSDVTEAQIGRQRIEFLASHDPLTGLLNRKSLVDAISAMCQAPSNGRFALLLLDLDSFKAINDNLGHLAGDNVLKTVADRLRGTIRPGDVAARNGGDEFAVLLSEVDEARALEIADRISMALSESMPIDTLSVRPSGSIGIALYPEHGNDEETLIRRADLALYRAKERGKNAACLFEFEFELEYLGRIRLQAELAAALDSGEVFLQYQPIVDARSRDVVSAEALVRWHHPVRGTLSAEVFMATAELSDLIERLGENVLRMACLAAAGWPNPVPVAVNLSPKQLRSGRFVSILKSCLQESGLLPTRLSLEVTETIFLAASASIVSQLDEVRALGVRLILDDFGTGYSSLTYLRGFDVDGIKIDKSFTRDLPESGKVAAIVRTIGRLASDMNIYVVAEGVETQEQLDWLVSNGIPFAQGYLLGRPGEDSVFSGAPLVRQHWVIADQLEC